MKKGVFCVLVLILLLFISSACGTANSEAKVESEEDIVGLWHNTPHLYAGYGERYIFYGDMTFIFEKSQTDGENRKLGYSGTWSIKDNKLIVSINKERTLVGGHLEKSPSTISGNEIVGGEIIETELAPIREIVFIVDSEDDGSGIIYHKITSDKTQFYKIGPAIN